MTRYLISFDDGAMTFPEEDLPDELLHAVSSITFVDEATWTARYHPRPAVVPTMTTGTNEVSAETVAVNDAANPANGGPADTTPPRVVDGTIVTTTDSIASVNDLEHLLPTLPVFHDGLELPTLSIGSRDVTVAAADGAAATYCIASDGPTPDGNTTDGQRICSLLGTNNGLVSGIASDGGTAVLYALVGQEVTVSSADCDLVSNSAADLTLYVCEVDTPTTVTLRFRTDTIDVTLESNLTM